MNSSRLFILAMLDEHGPMHGHQIRLKAQEDRTQLWTDIAPGALYGALGRLQREGLIETVRTERQGKYPERVVYAITPSGYRALLTLRDESLRTVRIAFDPFDLALAMTGPIEPDRLLGLIQNRIDELRVRRNVLAHQREVSAPWLNTAESAVIRHVTERLEADIAWHESVLALVPAIAEESHIRRPLDGETEPGNTTDKDREKA
jgi:DNA-binding PadR family transcriptional regulator